MKKSLVSLLTVGVLLAPSALVFAEEGLDSEVDNKTSEQDYFENIPKSWDDERLTITPLEDTSAIAYETKRVPNADMFEDEDEVVVTPGVDGVLTTTTQIAQWKGNAASWLPGGGVRELPEVTTEPITQVVEYGTAVRGQEKDTTRIDIPFETKVVENDELPVGTEEVSQEGVDGWYELTTIYETKDGERTGVIIGEEGAETDRKEPVNKIIQKGTKEVEGEFVVTATLVDEDGNALAGEVLTITGEDVEQKLTTYENGAVTFSVPNGTYTVAFGINSKTVVVEDEDISVELVAGPKDVVIPDEFYIGAVLNDFPQFDAEGNEYEVERLDDFVFVTITEKGGEFVVEIEYNLADNTTRIISIPTTPLEPAKPIEKDEETTEEETTDEESDDNFYVNVVKNDFPQYDKEGYSYEVEALEDFVFITITNVNGEFVADIEYNIADQTTRIVSIALIPLEPAQPIEETTEEETTDEEESTVEESEVVDVVTADGQPVRVVRTDSRSELPETGELGGATAMMAAALSALGGLGLLFKKRK